MQAAAAFPLFAGKFALFPELSNAIDSRKKLLPVLRTIIGLNPGRLKRLRHVTIPPPAEPVTEFGQRLRGVDAIGVFRDRRFSLSASASLEELVSLIRNFDTNWTPDNDPDWKMFCDVAAGCLLPLGRFLELEPSRMFDASGGRWCEFQEKLARAAGIPAGEFDRRRIALATADAMEAADDFSRTVILPLLLSTILEFRHPLPAPDPSDVSEASRLAFSLLIGNAANPGGRLLELARSWIARIPALLDADGDTGTCDSTCSAGKRTLPRTEWPGLASEFVASNGLVIRNLTTLSELREESARLAHCVGRLYVGKCLRGDSQIFSVQDRDGRVSLATLEVDPPRTNREEVARLELRLVQTSGYRNRKPDDSSLAACEEWLSAIKRGNLKLDLEATINWRSRYRVEEIERARDDSDESNAARWRNILGLNWREATVRQAVWEEWRQHILRGGFARSRTPAVIYSGSGVQRLLERMSPQTVRSVSAIRHRPHA